MLVRGLRGLRPGAYIVGSEALALKGEQQVPATEQQLREHRALMLGIVGEVQRELAAIREDLSWIRSDLEHLQNPDND